MKSLALLRVNRYVLRKQHLLEGSRIDDILQIAGDICGLHATGVKEPYLALLARSRSFQFEQLSRELNLTRKLIKMRCMRGTLYLLTHEVAQTAFAATQALVQDLSERFAEFRGASMQSYHTTVQRVLELMDDRELTLAEIKTALGDPPALSAMLNLMCDQALLARIQHGRWQSKSYRYAAFGAYYPELDLKKYDEATALQLLILRYLQSFGPANLDDIAWWIGVLKSKTKEALNAVRDQLREIEIEGLPGAFFLPRAELQSLLDMRHVGEPSVNILPILDPYLMGYRHRQRYLDPSRYDYIFDRTGNATSTILVEGRVTGIWDYGDSSSGLKYYLFEDLEEGILAQVRLKLRQAGLFLTGKETEIKSVGSMTPLKGRTAGGFISPLKSS